MFISKSELDDRIMRLERTIDINIFPTLRELSNKLARLEKFIDLTHKHLGVEYKKIVEFDKNCGQTTIEKLVKVKK